MHFEILGVLTIILGLAALTAPVRLYFYIMIVTTVLGTAAAFQLTALAGASVLLSNTFLIFYTLRVFLAYGEGPWLGAFAPPRPGFYLFLLTAFGVFSAMYFPVLLAGMTKTMSVERVIGLSSVTGLSPLHFSSSNITQSVYAIGGLVCFATTFAFFRKAGTPDDFVNAILLVGGISLVFAVIDLVSYFSHMEYVLDFLRTANYALLTGTEKGGLKRISGSFPEASSFADFTLVIFAITASLWIDRFKSRWIGPITALSLLALILSTSATGLVGLAALLPVLGMRSVSASTPGGGRPAFLVAMFVGVILAFLVVPLLLPDVADNVREFLDEVVFSKADSQSGQERFMWNATAFQTFIDTIGIGAGLGSARASSYALVLLSNVGIIGTVLFVVFLVCLLRSNTTTEAVGSVETSMAARACKLGIIAGMATACTSGTVYDVGLVFYILAGAVAAFTSPRFAEYSNSHLQRSQFSQRIDASGAAR